MGKGAPKGPSESQIQAQSDLEAQRVKYEDEKRRFLERVASYELLTREAVRSQTSSFEVQGVSPVPDASRQATAPFDPTFDPSQLSGTAQSEFYKNNNWFWAPNLGVTQASYGIVIPPPSQGRRR